MWQSISSSGVTTEIEGRQTHLMMNDPRERGLERIEQGWITDFLHRTSNKGPGICAEDMEPSDEPQLDLADVSNRERC